MFIIFLKDDYVNWLFYAFVSFVTKQFFKCFVSKIIV